MEKIIGIIPKPIVRNNDNKVILWLNMKDIWVFVINLFFYSPIWITLIVLNYSLAAFIVLAISFLISGILVINFGSNKRMYHLIWYLIKFCYVSKKIEKRKIEKKNNVFILEKEVFTILKIDGISTSLMENDEKKNIYNKLDNLYFSQSKTNRFDLVKIKNNFELETINKKSNNDFINELIKEENKLIKEFNSLDEKEIFLLIVYSKDENDLYKYINQLKNILLGTFIDLIEVNNNVEAKVLDQIFFSDKKIELKVDHFIIDEKYHSIIAIDELPNIVGNEWNYDIFKSHKEIIVCKNKSFTFDESKKMIDKAINNAKYECGRRKHSEHEMMEDQLVYETLTEQVKKIASNQDSIINCSYFIILKEDTKKELELKKKMLISLFKSLGIKINSLIFRQQDAIISLTSSNNKLFKSIGVDVLSSTVGMGFPLEESITQDSNCFVFGKNDNGEPITIDWKKRDDNKNMSNSIFIGVTGSGKTTACKKMIKNQVAESDYICYVIDPENEYTNLFKKIDGNVIGSKEAKINPFQFIPFSINVNGELITRTLNDHIQNLESIFQVLLEDLWNHQNKTILLNACYAMYNDKRYKTKESIEFTFSDLYNFLKKEIDSKSSLLNAINLYVKGNAYGDLFDYKSDFNLENNHICFNLQDVTSSNVSIVKKVKVLLLLNYLEDKVINNYLNDNKKYISIVVDEGHLFINSKDDAMIRFFDAWFRRIRKYNGMVSFVTQNLIDLKNNNEYARYTKSIINNSHYMLIFNIKSDDKDVLHSLMIDKGGLTSEERSYLSECKNGKGILFEKNKRSKIQVFA